MGKWIRILLVFLVLGIIGCEEDMVRNSSSENRSRGGSNAEDPKKTVQSDEVDLAPRPQKAKR